jgi:peroxiredoxin
MADYSADALEPGAAAPDFELRSTPDQSVRLADFRRHPLIIAFYPADWSPVCTDQMALYNEVLPEFRRHNANLAGISIDHAWCHAAFAQSRNLHFPLLADFHPKGEVAKRYGVYDDRIGMCRSRSHRDLARRSHPLEHRVPDGGRHLGRQDVGAVIESGLGIHEQADLDLATAGRRSS